MQKSIFKNAIFKLILNLFNLVVPLLIGPYVARTLGPDALGSINLANSILAYFLMFASFGVYQYGVRELSKIRDNKEKMSQTFTSLFLFTIVTNVIVFIVYMMFAMTYKSSDVVMYNISLIFSFTFLANLFYIEWINESLENYQFITIKTIIIRIAYIAAIFICIKTSNDLYEYAFFMTVSTFANNFISYLYIKRSIKFDFSNIAIIKHIKPMFSVVILNNSNMLYTQLDKIMLGSKNKTGVAFYTMAQAIIIIINSLMLTLIQVTVPRLTHLSNDNEEEYMKLLNKITSIYFIIIFPAAVGVFVLAREIILIYGGEEYYLATSILQVFAIYLVVSAYENILGSQVLFIKGKEKLQIKIVFICGIINFLLNGALILIGQGTPTNFLITTTFSNALLTAIYYWYIKNKMKINITAFNRGMFKYLLVSLAFFPIARFINYLTDNLFVYAFGTAAVSAVVYFLVLLILRDKILLEILNTVLVKLKLRKS